MVREKNVRMFLSVDFFREPVSMVFSGGVFSSLFLILIVEKKHLTTKNLNHTLILKKNISQQRVRSCRNYFDQRLLINKLLERFFRCLRMAVFGGHKPGSCTFLTKQNLDLQHGKSQHVDTQIVKTPTAPTHLIFGWQDFQA